MTRRAIPLALLLFGASAGAQTSAAERFDRGVRLAVEGDHRGALVEFQAAYEATRNPEVLFNIAAAHERLNDYVEAEEVLARYERLCPPAAFARHRAEVVAAQQRLRERVGALRVRTAHAALSCSVDGVARGLDALAAGLRVSMGRRTLRCEAAGYERFERGVDVRGEEAVDVDVALTRRRAPLDVSCALAGAEVRVDGAAVGRTPLAGPLQVPEGRHEVEVRHPGYEAAREALDVGAAGARFEARMRWREPVPPEEAAWLVVRASEPGALASIDGRRHGGDGRAAIPPGHHRLRVEREGFIAAEREVSLRLGERATEDVRLSPTPAFRESFLSDARARRTRWIALVASGVAAAVGGGVWLGLSLPPFLDANRRIDEAGRALVDCRTGACPLGSATYDARLAVATREAESLQPQVWISGAVLGVGLVAAVVGAVLAADAPSSRRFDAPSTWHIGASLSGVRVEF